MALPILAGMPAAWAAGNATTRGASWYIGSNLAFAALLYMRDAEPETVDQFLSKATKMAETAGVVIKPLPAKQGTSPETMATVIHYLIQGDGWDVGRQLSQKFENDHGIYFEVAVKSSLLTLLYQPGDDSGIGGIITDRCEKISLPPELWKPVTDAVAAGKDPEVVRDAVFKMHDDVTKYLFEQGG